MDADDDAALERARTKVSEACLGSASVHAVGADPSARAVIAYYADEQHPDLEQLRQRAQLLAAPFDVRFVHSPRAVLAGFSG